MNLYISSNLFEIAFEVGMGGEDSLPSSSHNCVNQWHFFYDDSLLIKRFIWFISGFTSLILNGLKLNL